LNFRGFAAKIVHTIASKKERQKTQKEGVYYVNLRDAGLIIAVEPAHSIEHTLWATM
jgi:hypothetical protein